MIYNEIKKVLIIEIGIVFLFFYVVVVIYLIFVFIVLKNFFDIEVVLLVVLVMGSLFLV